MNILRNALIVLLVSATTAMAAPASENSIKQLLAVTQTRDLLDGMRTQTETLMDNAIQQKLEGKTPSVRQQQAITNMKKRMLALIQEELTWGKMEQMSIRLYKESFTEEEVVGMLSFYKTPAGQAVIHKMPLITQNTMLEIQKMISRLSPQMQKIQQDFLVEIKAASN